MPKMKLLKLTVVVFLQIYSVVSTSSSSSIVIVGAGAAGIAAATKLLNNGFKNVIVLEAENRIGGRINSVFFGGAYVDLGAQWCHGKQNNIVYETVKHMRVLQVTRHPTTVYHSSDLEFNDKFGADLVQIFDMLYSPDGHRNIQEGENLGQTCIRNYNKTIYEKYEKFPEKLEMAKSSVDLFHHLVLSDEGSFSWFKPSAQSDYTTCGENVDYHWNGYGYKTVLEALKPPDLDQKIILNKTVISIFTFFNSSIIYCSDGTVFKARHVILTPSVGVLKRNYRKMFYPALPRAKIAAIKAIGFDAVVKIAAHFDEKWWFAEDSSGFLLLWSKEDKLRVAREFFDENQKTDPSWVTEVFLILPAEQNPNVLYAWVTGEMVPHLERLSDDVIRRGLEYVFRKFLGHKYNVSTPNAVLRTLWYTNPHFRGTYSYQTVKARKQEIKAEMELAKPIISQDGVPVLQFAGEASHPYYFSTVHGAIETGFREAERLINFYK